MDIPSAVHMVPAWRIELGDTVIDPRLGHRKPAEVRQRTVYGPGPDQGRVSLGVDDGNGGITELDCYRFERILLASVLSGPVAA